MPIKELNVSFRITVEALAQALATSNSGMKIDVLGTDDTPKIKKNGHAAPLALPAPHRGVRRFLLAHMKQDPDKTYTSKELTAAASNHGWGAKNVQNAVANSWRDGQVRRVGRAQYRLTKMGANHG